MKKTIILPFLLCATSFLAAQNYLITFTGSGLSTQVNSVTVSNLSRDTTITMNGTDTLMLLHAAGIKTPERNTNPMVAFPNPSLEQTFIRFNNPASAQVVTEVLNAAGKLIIRDQKTLDRGEHTYCLENLPAGVYWIIAHSQDFHSATKCVSIGHQKGQPALFHTSIAPYSQNIQRTMDTKNLITLPYADGEILLFKGKSGNHSRIVTLVPTQNEVVHFEFISCVDNDNNYYPVVTIGAQTWMAANLRTTKFNDNTPIPYAANAGAWTTTFSSAYCWYNSDSATYGSKYGALYKWFAVETEMLCPSGWHVPTPAEWNTLATTLGGDTVAGAKLKETGTLHWDSLNMETTNESGFSARPGGLRLISNGNFTDEGLNGYFWTASDYSSSFAHIRSVNYNTNKINAIGNNKGNGLSVRCIRD